MTDELRFLPTSVPFTASRMSQWFIGVVPNSCPATAGVNWTEIPSAVTDAEPTTGAVAMLWSKIAGFSVTQETAARASRPAKRIENIFFIVVIC